MMLNDGLPGVTHHGRIFALDGEHDLYISTACDLAGKLTWFRITLGKQGEDIRAIMEMLCEAACKLLAAGIPLDEVLRLFEATHFEPSGRTSQSNHIVTSPADYTAKWLRMRYLGIDGKSIEGV